MTGPVFSFVPVMDHEIHVTQWGDPAAKPLIMWHGLARTGRDFDELAARLSDEHFVICPDAIGRGLSSWATDPEAEYCIEYLSGIAVDLLDHFGIDRVGWLGTSMGGLVGMRLASGPMADRLSWLIVNDIGPELPDAAIRRITAYVGQMPRFPHLAQAESWLRSAYAPFGPAADAFWTRMARTSVRRRADGGFSLHYDPALLAQFTASRHELTSWDRYDRLTLPMHVIQGQQSDLLTPGILTRMRDAGPRPGVTVIPDCGHAPTLSRPEDIQMIRALVRDLQVSAAT